MLYCIRVEWLKKKIRHGGIMAWRGWPSVFQDSLKNMAPCWRMKLPNGFCNFLARPSDTRLVPVHLAATPSVQSVKSILCFSAASWSEDPPSATLTQAFPTVCLSNSPPRTRAGCISVQGRPASSTRCRQ